MGAEAAEVAQAVDGAAAAARGVVERGEERQPVVVDAAEDGVLHVRHVSPSTTQVLQAAQPRRIGRSVSASVRPNIADGASSRMGQVITPCAVTRRDDEQTSASSTSGASVVPLSAATSSSPYPWVRRSS